MRPRKKLMLIGGGGHCFSVIDSVISTDSYDDIGIIDTVDNFFPGVSVIGTDDDIPELIKNGWNSAFVAVGSVGNTVVRRKLYEMIKRYGLNIPTIIDPTASVAKSAEVKEGSFLGKKAIVNAGAKIGLCSIINTGAVIEHECERGDFSHISPGSTVCGRVRIGSDSHIGAGSVVIQQITIGNNVLVGAGSVVVKDLGSGVKAFGNPCKVVSK